MTPHVQCPSEVAHQSRNLLRRGLMRGHMIFRLASALRPNRSLLGNSCESCEPSITGIVSITDDVGTRK